MGVGQYGAGFFFQAEDGIRDGHVTEFRRVLFRSVRRRTSSSQRSASSAEVSSGNAAVNVSMRQWVPCSLATARPSQRSEERRVGKEWGGGGGKSGSR